MSETKVCNRCGIDLPVSCFGVNSSNKDRLFGNCKKCGNARVKSLHDADPAYKEKSAKWSREWRKNNLSRAREIQLRSYHRHKRARDAACSTYQKQQSVELTDVYVARVICHGSPALRARDVPLELIQVKREHLALARALSEFPLHERQEKRCPKCCEMKPRQEYGEDPRYRDGLKSYCKPCAVTASRESARKKAVTPEYKEARRKRNKKYNSKPSVSDALRKYQYEYSRGEKFPYDENNTLDKTENLAYTIIYQQAIKSGLYLKRTEVPLDLIKAKAAHMRLKRLLKDVG